MNRDRDMRHAVASHRVMAASLDRDRLADLARRQDEHIAHEKAVKAEDGDEPQV